MKLFLPKSGEFHNTESQPGALLLQKKKEKQSNSKLRARGGGGAKCKNSLFKVVNIGIDVSLFSFR